MAETKALFLENIQRSDVKEILKLIVERYAYSLVNTQ